MEHLKELRDKYLNTDATAVEILKQIFDTYLIEDYLLESHKLDIEYIDYGLHRLRQNGQCLYEGEKSECLEEAYEIINKTNKL